MLTSYTAVSITTLFSSHFDKISKLYFNLDQYPFEDDGFTQNFEEKVDTVFTKKKVYYIGQISKDTKKRDGVGMILFESGCIQEGHFKNNQANGHGRVIWSHGLTYTGNWKDGWYDGYGQLCYNDGRIYKGHCIKGQQNGQGTMFFPDGSKQDGQWKDGNFME